jgi:DNA-binding NarL/FixJ family response regulator
MNQTELTAAAGTIRVLVLDDHVMFAESLSRLLRDEPDVEVVGITGRLDEAVALAAREQPDVVVLDYLLPDSTFPAAASGLRAVAPDVKLLVVTAYNEQSVLMAALDARCDGFVTKGQAARDVVHAMRAIRAGRREVSIDLVSQAWSPPAALRTPGRAPLRTDRLTPREHEVLVLLAGDRSSAEIAARLGLSVNTVRNHVQRIFGKLGAHSKREAIDVALADGLLDEDASVRH